MDFGHEGCLPDAANRAFWNPRQEGKCFFNVDKAVATLIG
jgi:hypothetical protein